MTGIATEARTGRELPSGTVTFVFTDIEGSTNLARSLGTDRWRDVLVPHAAIVRAAAARNEGVEVRTEGDSFFLAFRTTRQAVAAAADAQRALAAALLAAGAVVSGVGISDIRPRGPAAAGAGTLPSEARPQAAKGFG